MEIKINGQTYEVPDACAVDGPKKGILKRHLDQHGPESFLASTKYGQYAPCILDELEGKGAEVVGPTRGLEQPAPESEVTPSSAPVSIPITASLAVPGDALGDPHASCPCGGEPLAVVEAPQEETHRADTKSGSG